MPLPYDRRRQALQVGLSKLTNFQLEMILLEHLKILTFNLRSPYYTLAIAESNSEEIQEICQKVIEERE